MLQNIKLREIQKQALKTVKYVDGDKGLFELTCGTGKTVIQAAILDKVAEKLEKDHKKGLFFVSSHRLSLNEQLISEYAKYIPDFEKRFVIKNMCSLKNEHQKFDKEHFIYDFNEDNDKHYLIVSCCQSENDDLDQEQGFVNTLENIGLKIDLMMQDEVHKNTSIEMIKKYISVSKQFYGFSATPDDDLRTLLGLKIKMTYPEAIKAGIVLPCVCKTINIGNPEKVKGEKDEQYLRTEATVNAFNHLKAKYTIPSMIVFNSSVDNVAKIGSYLNEFKNKEKLDKNVNICEFASEKEGITKGCKLNGELIERDILLSRLRDENDLKYKPKIILNCQMLSEGIDIPSINGVVIYSHKSDASLYQAVMRGCRKDKDKKDFNLYVLAEEGLESELKIFFTKLFRLCENGLDFGSKTDIVDGTIKKDHSIQGYEITIESPMRYKNFGTFIEDMKLKFECEAFKNQYLEDLRDEIKDLKKSDKALVYAKNIFERAKYGVSFEELNSLIFG